MSVVSIARAENRYKTVQKALTLISDDIKDVKNKKVLIKPNFVSDSRQLAATHVDTVKATIEFIQKFGPKEIIVGEGSAGDTLFAFKNFGYLNLPKEYGVELVDLNEVDYIETSVFDSNFEEILIKISKTALECDYRISSAMLKTHDTVIVTLSLKNMAMGVVIGDDKPRVHQGYQAINLNLYKLAKLVPSHLSVIDGWEGMEGNGPVSGKRVEMRIALAGIDFVAVDAIAAYVMGFQPQEIGYLNYATTNGLGVGDLSKIKIVGIQPEKVKRKFKTHSSYESQKRWKINEGILQKLLSK